LKGWKKRVKIQIRPNIIDSDLRGFPLLVYIRRSSGRSHTDLTFIFDELQGDKNRKKIAVTLADGLTQCYVEIESWDHGRKEARLYVRVPKISSSLPTVLYLYFDRNHPDNTTYVGDVDSEVARKVWEEGYVLVHHLRSNRTKVISLFQFQKRLLELLFPERWFLETAKKNHPAYIRWDLCNRIINQKGILKFPQQQNELVEISRILLDSYILTVMTGSDMKDMSLRELNYGDEAVQKKILSRITYENQFEDIMVELYIGAWHLGKGHQVTPFEEKGLPDLKVEFATAVYPAFIECKHLRTRTRRRITDLIRKANNQIKKTADPGYGIVVIDATIPVAAGIVEDDSLPAQTQESIRIVRSALSGNKNTSIGTALIVWIDNMVKGRPPSKKTLVVLRRRHVRIDHTNPNIIVPDTLPLFNGWNASFSVTWSQREHQ